MVPEWIVDRIRDSGVEARLRERPPPRPTNRIGQGEDVIVGVGVAERLAGGVKEVLAIDEDDRALSSRLRRQAGLRAKNNPARGLSAYRAGGKSPLNVARGSPYAKPCSCITFASADPSCRVRFGMNFA